MTDAAPKVVLLFGPTGVGKTDLLDRLFAGRGEVVSADALQVYKRQDIGTAKPEAELLKRLPHHLIDIIDFQESFSVAEFCRRADKALSGIVERGRVPVISGGTAYYFKGWLMGLPKAPAADPEVRASVEAQWAAAENADLKAALAEVDPVSAERIGANDRYRMLRAMEVYKQSGQPLSSFDIPQTPRKDYKSLLIGLQRDREDLYERINRRVEQMFDAGLKAEVEALVAIGARKNHPGMKAIGYSEWFAEEGCERLSVERIKELIARNSRRYAKRQITFFSSLPNVHWFHPEDDIHASDGIADCVKTFLDGE